MKKINIDADWLFTRKAPSVMSAMMPDGEKVNLPHDATISTNVNKNSPNGTETGFYDGCFANYNKHYVFPKEWEGKRVFLYLDGSFWCTEVSLNGHLMGMHPSGYAPYCVELTDKINFGESNRINLFVNNSQQRTGRWYTGTGVYRHVYLIVGEAVHLSVNSTFVCAKDLDGNVIAKVGVENQTKYNKTLKIKVTLYDGENKAVCAEKHITLKAKASAEAEINFKMKNPKLWDIDNPFLYSIKTQLWDGEKEIDCAESECGLRVVSITRQEGLMLNGKPLKLKGGCVHSDNGILGAVSVYDAEYRKVKLHKKAGYNAFRCAHNPPSEDFLKACDRLGMLVLDELFDVWRMYKDPNDYHLYFDAWWKKDAYNSVMRDRTHPCVFAYSLGNEIGERNGLNGGYELAKEVAEYVRTADNTRTLNLSLPTTFNGLNDKDTAAMFQSLAEKMQSGTKIQNLTCEFSEKIFNEKTEPFVERVEVVGYNYIENRYEDDMKTFPERIFIQTESYPKTLGFVWNLVEQNPCILGDFLWTSIDYLGEAGLGYALYSDKSENKRYNRLNVPHPGFPWRTANCGDFDLTGNERNQMQYRQCVWGSKETFLEVVHPDKYGKEVFVSPYGWEDAYNGWTFDGFEGRPAKAVVYSSAKEVELFVNGISLGKKPCGKPCDYTAEYDVVYNKGEITAVSFSDGKEISRRSYKTAGKPCKLVVETDKTELSADGNSLAYVSACIADENGNFVPCSEKKCTAKAEGEIMLAAFGSANPATEENYTIGEFTTYRGKILAIVRSGYKRGKGKLTISADGYKNITVDFTVQD